MLTLATKATPIPRQMEVFIPPSTLTIITLLMCLLTSRTPGLGE